MKPIALATLAALVLSAALASCNDTPETYYTVTFDANGGTIIGNPVLTVAEGDPLPNLHFLFTLTPLESHTHEGWYLEPEQINEWNIYSEPVTSDITLYAGWERYYSCTYHGNGGYIHGRSLTETWKTNHSRWELGYPLPIPENVKRLGYVLEGWYKDEGLTERWDFATDMITGDVDLYARWSPTIEGLTRNNYPRVDGATSTRALNVMIACKLLWQGYKWETSRETSEAHLMPDGESLNEAGTYLGGIIKTSQTNGAMMNLIDGTVDIILRSTTASPDEAAARAAGVTLIETPIALDAFVFLKYPTNSVSSLTLDQIRQIYTGQITNWSQLGGRNAAIKPFTRPRNSGSEEAFRDLVMGDLDPADFPVETQQVHSMTGLFWEMEREGDGIGYIFKNYKERIMNRHEPVFSIDGVQPTPATIKNRTYPLTTEVYAIVRTDLDRNSMAWKLYEWLQSDAAKMTLEECGFTPLD